MNWLFKWTLSVFVNWHPDEGELTQRVGARVLFLMLKSCE